MLWNAFWTCPRGRGQAPQEERHERRGERQPRGKESIPPNHKDKWKHATPVLPLRRWRTASDAEVQGLNFNRPERPSLRCRTADGDPPPGMRCSEVPQTNPDASCSPKDRDEEGEEHGLDGSQEEPEQENMNLRGKSLLVASNLSPVEIFVFSLRRT